MVQSLKLIVPFPSMGELKQIVLMTQKTLDETADRVLDAQELLRMRKTAREIPVIDEVIDFTMKLVAATHPDSEQAGETSKKYIRMGASPRAAQALITAAKVRALVQGKYNVSMKDIEALAYPVLRHRIKLSFDAIAARKEPDELIAAILAECGRSKGLFKR